jgi:hypothetical protein
LIVKAVEAADRAASLNELSLSRLLRLDLDLFLPAACESTIASNYRSKRRDNRFYCSKSAAN